MEPRQGQGIRGVAWARLSGSLSGSGWDVRLTGRALALGVLAFAVAWLVTAATDEGNVGWGVRAGRTLPIAPACAALGTLIALMPARLRGEMRALEALGRAPWQAGLGGVVGGAAAAVAVAAAMGALHTVDVSGFFPVATHGTDYHYADGAFVDRVRGLRVEADGELERDASAREAHDASGTGAVPDHGRAAAALAMGLSGVALPLLFAELLLAAPLPEAGGVTRRGRNARRASVVGVVVATGAAIAASVVLFDAAAARRIPALVAAVPAAVLLVGALVRYGGAAWWRGGRARS